MENKMSMRIVSVKQGTPEWDAHRAATFNASDAPAMLGKSPYKSRDELIREYATGEHAEVDERTQKRFEDGHKFEALARPLVEQRIGDDLFPIVGVADDYNLPKPLGASYDGMTMVRQWAFEHKSMNNDIRAAEDVSQLPEHIRIQMDQQLMVCRDLEGVFFMATKWKWDEQIGAYELTESKEFIYKGDAQLQVMILEGWKQFYADVEAYKASGPKSATKGIASSLDSLPTLAIQLRGEVVSSNVPALRSAVASFLGAINYDLDTDDDFATAEATMKFCGEAEKKIAAILEAAFAQTESIEELRRAVQSDIGKLAEARLKLEKIVKRRKDEIKDEIVSEARKKIDAKLAEVSPLFGKITPDYERPNFAAAIKGKRNLDKLREAADGEAIRICSIIQDIAGKVAMRREWFNATYGDFAHLFADMQSLIYKETDDFKAAVELRIKSYQEAQAAKEAEAKRTQTIIEAPIQTKSAAMIEPDCAIPPTPEAAMDSRPKNPGRMALIDCISSRWGVSISVARDWIIEEFGGA
jgi:putative phage-type endonuclease